MDRQRLKRLGGRVARTAFWSVLVLSLLIGFGMTGGNRVVQFRDAVGTWPQKDFRQITMQYATLGHEAMRTRIAGVPAGRIVMAVRSIPGLPPDLAVAETSELHYRRFSQGPLSAYLHLSSEQGPGMVSLFENLATQKERDDERVREFLSGFKLLSPTSTTPEAVASVRKLLADVDASRPFAVREVVNYSMLKPSIEAAAAREGIPSDPEKMTADQQYRVLALLDEQVRLADTELWRAKQVNDFLSGVWGQGYGPTYVGLINGVFVIRNVARAIAIAGVLIVVVGSVRRRRK